MFSSFFSVNGIIPAGALLGVLQPPSLRDAKGCGCNESLPGYVGSNILGWEFSLFPLTLRYYFSYCFSVSSLSIDSSFGMSSL